MSEGGQNVQSVISKESVMYWWGKTISNDPVLYTGKWISELIQKFS